GDGETSTDENPCHSYDSSGQYNITLEVTDANGCTDRQEMKASIIVLPDIKTNFTMNGSAGCVKTTYTFVNKTDTNGIRIKKWYWDFGDGSAVDSVNWSPKHTYTADGNFTVTLRIINQLGCEASYTQTATNYIIKLEVFYKDTVCWSEAKKGHSFRAREIPGASYWEWEFGDPPSGVLNKAPFAWNSSHLFVSGPKNYEVKFTALHPVCGKFDTCIVLHVAGPQAIIIQPDPIPMVLFAVNNYLPAKPMPLSEFAAVNAGNNCMPKDIKYSTFSKLGTPKRMVQYKFCNSTINTKTFNNVKYCDGDSQNFASAIDLKPIDSVVTYIDSVENKLTWTKGQPIPKNPYYPSSGQLNTRNMHDSNLFTCQVPDLVRFTNHSLKYRLYKALDDNPKSYVHWDTPEPDYAKIIFENGWKDTCINTGYPFASDSMKYLWNFNDGKKCTSTVSNKDWECQYSTLIAPYHFFDYTKAPDTRCKAVSLEVTDEVMNCTDKATIQLKQGPPQAWWDRSVNGYCKMTWEMQQFMTDKGEAGNPDKPLRGFIMDWQQNCTGFGEFFRLNFSETLPSCEPAKEWWVTFDSAASSKVICTAGGKKYVDHGFMGANNAKGYPVAGPKATWTGLPWLNRYWYMDGDEGCKTIGLVLKNGNCYDTAWYHDYICFNRLTAEFNINKENMTIIRDGSGNPLDTNYTYTLMDSSQRLSSQSSGRIYCHAFGAATKPGFNIALVPNDRKMPVVTDFLFQIRRQEFPSGDFYYTKNNPGSILKGFWPDTATLNPYNIKRRKTDKSPLDPNISQHIDSVSSIYDTIYIPVDSSVYTYQYDQNGNILGNVFINGLQMRTKEVNEINATGQTILPTNDFRSRYLSLYCKTKEFPVRTSITPLRFKDTIYMLKLIDPRPDDRTFIIDPKTGKPTADSIAIKDTVKFTLPFPGFYTIASASRNLDGCIQSTLYHLIYGHFARFNIKGGDSIICVGDTVRFDYMVRYWTTNCPPLPGGPPPAGCIDGTINNYTNVLTPWDVKDAIALRQQLDTKWKKPAGYREEELWWNYGDNSTWYGGPAGQPKGTEFFHVFNKPGIFDVTMRTIDSNGCAINTVRRNLIKVVGLDAKFEVTPLRDTLTICRKDLVLQDKTELIGSELNERGKFGYKDRVVKRDPFTGQFYLDSARFAVDSIIAWRWDPGNGTVPITKTDTDTLEIPYLRYGTYSPGLHVVTANNTPRQCTDEQFRPNYLTLKGPRPEFTVKDTAGCAPFEIEINVINDTSDSYEWVLEGSNETMSSKKHEDLVKFVSKKPGRWRLFVRQTETHYDPTIGGPRTCYDEWPTIDDTIQFWITVYPFGPLTISGDTVVCKNADVKFTSSSEKGEYELYEYTFQGGTPPSSILTDSVGTTKFTQAGKFWISVKGTTEHECVEYDSMQVRVEDVKALIGVDSTRADVGIFTFQNNSEEGIRYIWNFGDGTPEKETLLKDAIPHEYSAFEGDVQEGVDDIKRFKVTLKTISKIGCEATDSVWVEIPRKWKRYNVLTPNGDGDNDVFNPRMGGEIEYELSIFNRWGEKVFESNDSEIDWNGKVNNSGADCAEGTYFYVWKFKLIGGIEKTMNGTVTLLR
ncbi:MAG: PKD domain-containing protein, partial [Bacteroidia bacterium]